MQLGLPWWIGAGEPEEGIQLAAEAGYDFVEISLDEPWPDELDPIALADRADDAGVELGMHGPWRTQALAHPRDALAQASREVAQDCLAVARATEAGYIVFHVDARGFSGYPREDVVERGLQAAHASLQALARSGGDAVDVIVENTASPLGTPAEVAEFLAPMADVGFCLDPGHALIQAHRDPEAPAWDPADWGEAVGDAWSLTHLMDVIETESSVRDHLLPGAGEIDLAAILDEARAVGCERVLIEAFYADAEGAEIDTKRWREARRLVEEL